MSTDTSNACQAVIGLLVPRHCGAPSKGRCGKCNRAVCAEHALVMGAGVYCLHCERNEKPPEPVMDVPADLAFRNEDLEAFERDRTSPPSNAWSDLT